MTFFDQMSERSQLLLHTCKNFEKGHWLSELIQGNTMMGHGSDKRWKSLRGNSHTKKHKAIFMQSWKCFDADKQKAQIVVCNGISRVYLQINLNTFERQISHGKKWYVKGNYKLATLRMERMRHRRPVHIWALGAYLVIVGRNWEVDGEEEEGIISRARGQYMWSRFTLIDVSYR